MSSGEKIHIKHNLPSELINQITVDNVNYLVITEERGRNHAKACTMVYLDGKVVFSKEDEYSQIKGNPDFHYKLRSLMEKLHRSTITLFTSEIMSRKKKKSDYLDEAKKFLKDGKGHDAMNALKTGLERFPSDPFLMSYYGCLRSVVGKKHDEGIKACKEALKLLKIVFPYESEYYHPTFYLNLGRAYVAAGKKKEAVRSFNAGLSNDAGNVEIKKELEKLGKRRQPPVPFLNRGNPINKYIGIMLRRALS